jgi:hypothetical protein
VQNGCPKKVHSAATAQWRIDRTFLVAPAGTLVAQWLQSFRGYPPRQKLGSFNLNHVMEAMSKPANN